MEAGRTRVAITGGIGSGKSFVGRLIEARGIRIYDCDAAAKRLMRDDETLREALKRLAGNDVYQGNILQKRILARFLLGSEANKQAVNAVVHPAVARDFNNSSFNWLESAILFESGFDRRVSLDYVICVSAPEEVRVARIMRRDNIPHEQALQWIHRQMPQDEVERRSDFRIMNDGATPLDTQIETIINKIYK